MTKFEQIHNYIQQRGWEEYDSGETSGNFLFVNYRYFRDTSFFLGVNYSLESDEIYSVFLMDKKTATTKFHYSNHDVERVRNDVYVLNFLLELIDEFGIKS